MPTPHECFTCLSMQPNSFSYRVFYIEESFSSPSSNSLPLLVCLTSYVTICPVGSQSELHAFSCPWSWHKHFQTCKNLLNRLVRGRDNQARIGIWKCWFLRRGENRSTRRKTTRSREENQQQTQPTYDAASGNRTRDTLVGGERSHHCAIDLLIKVDNQQNDWASWNNLFQTLRAYKHKLRRVQDLVIPVCLL